MLFASPAEYDIHPGPAATSVGELAAMEPGWNDGKDVQSCL